MGEPYQRRNLMNSYIIKGKKLIIDGNHYFGLDNRSKLKKYTIFNPFDEDCEYLAICLPTFSMDLVNRRSNF
jgi:hypothetical protein